MRTFRSLLVLVFGLLAATSVFYAWQQQKALRTARLAAESLEKERTDLRKKLWESERRRGELESRDRPASVGTSVADTPNAAAANGEAGANTLSLPDTAAAGRFFSMMDNPEAQRLIAVQQRSALDARYSALFRMLNLSPAQLEKFKDLLVEKRTAVADVMAAARSQGLTGRENRDELRQLVNETQAEIDASIRAAVGETAFNQYQNFEQTQPQRVVVGQLEQRLSYSGTPLTPQQTEQLVQVLAANSPAGAQPTAAAPAVRFAAGGGAGPGGMFFTNAAPLSDQAVQQAATVLNATQVQALQQLQQEQQAQAQLSQLMREQMRNRRNSPTNTGSGNSTPTPPASPPRG